MSPDEVVRQALAQQECVLTRAGKRRVLLLDGVTVRIEGDGAGREPHVNASAAREAFIEAINRALGEGFEPAQRDLPKAAFVQPTRAPDPVELPEPPPVEWPPEPTTRHPSLKWLIADDAVRAQYDPFEGHDWDPLFSQPPAGVRFLDLEAEVPEDAIELLHQRGLPPWVRGLGVATFEALEDFCEATLDPAQLWDLVGQLDTLELRAGTVKPLPSSLPGLRHLGVWTSNATPELWRSITEGAWPALEVLEAWLDAETVLEVDDLLAALSPERFPALRYLALYEADHPKPALERLRAGPFAGLAGVRLGPRDELETQGTWPFPGPEGIHLLSDGRFYPLRCARFYGN